MAEAFNFGSIEEVLRYIQERSDDIEKVQIPQMPTVSITHPKNPHHEIRLAAGMIVRMVSGSFEVLSKDQAELVLNDGILTRMKIKIELMR